MRRFRVHEAGDNGTLRGQVHGDDAGRPAGGAGVQPNSASLPRDRDETSRLPLFRREGESKGVYDQTRRVCFSVGVMMERCTVRILWVRSLRIDKIDHGKHAVRTSTRTRYPRIPRFCCVAHVPFVALAPQNSFLHTTLYCEDNNTRITTTATRCLSVAGLIVRVEVNAPESAFSWG